MAPTDDGSCLVVVGDDGSAVSDTVWEWLTAHPWPGWRVEVMTADESEIVWGEPPMVTAWSPPWARSKSVEGAVGVGYARFAGDPRPMLGDRGDADLIVVGRSSRMTRGRALGGTTEWLLHHPPAPTAVIGDGSPVEEVTICADGSEHSKAAVTAFTSWPMAARTAVTVLAVDDGRAQADTSAAEATEILAGKVASVTAVVTQDFPTAAILRHLDTTRPDLVVLGTKGLTGWKRLRLGSTAGAVVRGAACNAMVASAGGA